MMYRMDDVEDNSELRRGLPVAHTVYGVPQTINTANYVYFLAVQQLLKLEKIPMEENGHGNGNGNGHGHENGEEGNGNTNGHGSVNGKGKGKAKGVEDLVAVVNGEYTRLSHRLRVIVMERR